MVPEIPPVCTASCPIPACPLALCVMFVACGSLRLSDGMFVAVSPIGVEEGRLRWCGGGDKEMGVLGGIGGDGYPSGRLP